MFDGFADAAGLGVVAEGYTLVESSGDDQCGAGLDLDQTIFRIPFVKPAGVLFEVSAFVVGAGGWAGRDVGFAFDDGDGIGAVVPGSGDAALNCNGFEAVVASGGAVVKIVGKAYGLCVERHIGRRGGCSEQMEQPGMIDGLDLVEWVGRVILGGAFAGGSFAVTDGVESVAEGIAGQRISCVVPFNS